MFPKNLFRWTRNLANPRKKVIRKRLLVSPGTKARFKKMRNKLGVITLAQVIKHNAEADLYFLRELKAEDVIQIIRNGTVVVSKEGWFFITFPEEARTGSKPASNNNDTMEEIVINVTTNFLSYLQEMATILRLPKDDFAHAHVLQHNTMVGNWCLTNIKKGDRLQLIKNGIPYFPEPVSADFLITWYR